MRENNAVTAAHTNEKDSHNSEKFQEVFGLMARLVSLGDSDRVSMPSYHFFQAGYLPYQLVHVPHGMDNESFIQASQSIGEG